MKHQGQNCSQFTREIVSFCVKLLIGNNGNRTCFPCFQRAVACSTKCLPPIGFVGKLNCLLQTPESCNLPKSYFHPSFVLLEIDGSSKLDHGPHRLLLQHSDIVLLPAVMTHHCNQTILSSFAVVDLQLQVSKNDSQDASFYRGTKSWTKVHCWAGTSSALAMFWWDINVSELHAPHQGDCNGEIKSCGIWSGVARRRKLMKPTIPRLSTFLSKNIFPRQEAAVSFLHVEVFFVCSKLYRGDSFLSGDRAIVFSSFIFHSQKTSQFFGRQERQPETIFFSVKPWVVHLSSVLTQLGQESWHHGYWQTLFPPGKYVNTFCSNIHCDLWCVAEQRNRHRHNGALFCSVTSSERSRFRMQHRDGEVSPYCLPNSAAFRGHSCSLGDECRARTQNLAPRWKIICGGTSLGTAFDHWFTCDVPWWICTGAVYTPSRHWQ